VQTQQFLASVAKKNSVGPKVLFLVKLFFRFQPPFLLQNYLATYESFVDLLVHPDTNKIPLQVAVEEFLVSEKPLSAIAAFIHKLEERREHLLFLRTRVPLNLVCLEAQVWIFVGFWFSFFDGAETLVSNRR
jgi:hypothetical protein